MKRAGKGREVGRSIIGLGLVLLGAGVATWAGCSEDPRPAPEPRACGSTRIPAEIGIDFLPVCDQCPRARCVISELIPAEQRSWLAPCAKEGELCAPELYIETLGGFTLPSCRSLGGVEGRCVSTCIPFVANQATRLPRSSCQEDERCAPCWNPLTGEDTGACRISCDPGPAEPAVTFEACCQGRAVCVPVQGIPAEQRGQLGRGGCQDEGALCVPGELADPVQQPVSCVSVAGSEGRCLSTCLPEIAGQAGWLPQGSCAADHLCAPCFDPRTGQDSAACRINGDSPQTRPIVFDACCKLGEAYQGQCVPAELTPEDFRRSLSIDSCASGNVCVPTALVNPGARPGACTSLGNAEGRCLPACLPEVERQAARLPQDSCPRDFLCAPCTDPLTGTDSGACRINGDAPRSVPLVFADCCQLGGAPRGKCVPAELTPETVRESLGSDTCQSADVCVPTELVDPSAKPARCTSLSSAEGRCLPECVPEVARQAARLPRDVCPAVSRCAPCFDPLSGEDTGVCRINGDSPVAAAVIYPGCCKLDGQHLGKCIPTELVPEEIFASLGADSCPGDALCVPTALTDPAQKPVSCDSIEGAEGRCLPACLPSIAAQSGRLPRGSCPRSHLCAPCTDPVLGTNTGACQINGDAPTRPALVFDSCCVLNGSSQGKCVPTDYVPESLRESLATDTCTSGHVCAPSALLDPGARPASCGSLDSAEGRCLAECLPAVAGELDRLPRSTCGTGERCAPCYDPLSGADSGACRINGDAPTRPAYVFPTCCHYQLQGRGRCLPESLVPEEDRESLPQEDCANSHLCVPNPIIEDPDYRFPTCQALDWLGLETEGACVPDCMVGDWKNLEGIFIAQDRCQAGELCAPCTVFLVETGACR